MTEPARRNEGAETLAIRAALDAWIRDRWGADVRVLHELALGRRRVDLVVVGEHDLAGIEIKGPRDRLDDRLKGQLETFAYYLPELWLAVPPKWRDHDGYRFCGVNRVVVFPAGSDIEFVEEPRRRRPIDRLRASSGRARDPDPVRDDMCCARLLELCWWSEVAAIAVRTKIIDGAGAWQSMHIGKLRGMLARLLTGHEIVRQVCTELRSRPLTGIGSDAPKARGAADTVDRRGGI